MVRGVGNENGVGASGIFFLSADLKLGSGVRVGHPDFGVDVSKLVAIDILGRHVRNDISVIDDSSRVGDSSDEEVNEGLVADTG